jgi:hypothetical protein
MSQARIDLVFRYPVAMGGLVVLTGRSHKPGVVGSVYE